ncbi:MAG: MarR family winged helix-turn-helix transcriptional regulator [Lachnospiraceae bacterium]
MDFYIITHEKLTKSVCDQYELTQMEYDILMFLYNNPQYRTAADIVKVRKSTKSHVSTSLKSLGDRGLVEKKQSEDNKKHIEILLLDSAREIIQAGLNVQSEFVRNMFQGLTEEEMITCESVFGKICNNAERYLIES